MDLLTTLQQSGLKEPEAKVYLALLERSPATVLPIAKAAGVTRTYCYDILESLIKQGLASYHEKNNRRRYTAQSPEHLRRLLEERFSSYSDALPELLSIHNKVGKPRVRFFEGTEGVWSVFEEALQTKQADSIYSPDHVVATFGQDKVDQLYQRVAKRKMNNRDLFAGSGQAPTFTTHYGPEQQYRWLPKTVRLKTDLILFADKLALISYEPEVHAVVIEGSSIVDTHRQLFELLWQAA